MITDQSAYHKYFGIDPPLPTNIHRWYSHFEETRSLCKGRNSDQPYTSDENVQKIQAFE